LLLMFACAQALAADAVDIQHAHIEASDEGYKLDARYSFELSHDLEDALMAGIKLAFTTEIELTRPRWYWTDDQAIAERRTTTIWYDQLTRKFKVQVAGSIYQSYPTLDEALVTIRRPGRWVIGPRSALKPGEVYTVTLRMFMDRQSLLKPLQVNALNNAGWQLSSGKKFFTYRAE
jgi:Domain of unknown function (DUF4390)